MEDGFFLTPLGRGLVNANIHPFCFFWKSEQWRLQRLQSLGPESEGISLVVPNVSTIQTTAKLLFGSNLLNPYVFHIFFEVGDCKHKLGSKQSKRHNTQSSFFCLMRYQFLVWTASLGTYIVPIGLMHFFVNFIWMRKPFLDSYFLGIVMGWLNIHIIIPKVAESKIFPKNIFQVASGWVGRFLGCSCCVIILLFLAMNLIVSFDFSVTPNQTERNRSLYVAYRAKKQWPGPPNNFNEVHLSTTCWGCCSYERSGDDDDDDDDDGIVPAPTPE